MSRNENECIGDHLTIGRITKIVSWSRERNMKVFSLDKILTDYKWPNFLILNLLVGSKV